MRSFIRKITPEFLLKAYRKRKKRLREAELEAKRRSGEVITFERLVNDLRTCGLKEGDDILVHTSLSKIGYVENGPETVVSALKKVIGEKGNILMPTSPNAGLQLEYIRSLEAFDVKNSPSALGAITEYFRKLPNVKRSAHPTEPVACIGPDADFYTEGHLGELTPYTDRSPFARISARGGKILYIGVTFDNAGTNLHTLEDAVDFKYPVYYDEVFDVKIILENAEQKIVQTKVHNPEQSAKRKCDGLIPLFKDRDVLRECKVGEARTLVVDAKILLEVMIEEYKTRGVTMYTPEGE